MYLGRKKNICFNSLLLIFFFFFGFNYYKIYLPVAFLVFIATLYRSGGFSASKSYYISTSLLLMGVLFPLIFGYQYVQADNYSSIVIYFTLLFVLISFVFYSLSERWRFYALFVFILGVFFEALLVIAFSMHKGEGYGYGRLYHPVGGFDVNSPYIGNNLVLATILFLYLILTFKFGLLWLLALISILVAALGAVYVGGRVYFILVFMLIPIVFLMYPNRMVVFLLIIFAVLAFLFSFDFLDGRLDFILQRFEGGIESKRFEHYVYGLNMLIDQPLGGWTVDVGIENTRWFHNIFLDIGKMLGLMPIFFIIVYFVYVFSTVFSRDGRYYNLAFLLFFACFILMQQDVIVEGNVRLISTALFCGIIMLCPKGIYVGGYGKNK